MYYVLYLENEWYVCDSSSFGRVLQIRNFIKANILFQEDTT